LRPVDLRAVDFLAPVRFLVAAAFRPAMDRLAAVRFLVAVAFLAVSLRPAVDRLAAVRFLVAAAFLPAAERLADDRFAVERRDVLLFAIAIPVLLPVPLGRHPLEASTFPFAHAPPHSVAFIATERVVEALDAHGTLAADPLGFPR
jgi:hypothetical protein